MSKQAQAKEAQGYQDKPTPRTCATCQHFTSERKLPTWMEREKKSWSGRVYSIELDGVETNLRCGVGGFAIKKTAVCSQYTATATSAPAQSAARQDSAAADKGEA